MKHLVALFIFGLVFLAAGQPAFAVEYGDNVMIFSLFQGADGSLGLDREAKEGITTSYDVNFSVVEFDQSQQSGQYQIHLYDQAGVDALQYSFNGTPGAFQYQMPYFPVISSYKIFATASQQLLLEGSLQDFVRCNANQVCEAEFRESINTCLVDCANSSTQYSAETQKLLDDNQGIVRDTNTGDILLRGSEPVLQEVGPAAVPETEVSKTSQILNLLTLIGAVIVLVGCIIILIRRRKKA